MKKQCIFTSLWSLLLLLLAGCNAQDELEQSKLNIRSLVYFAIKPAPNAENVRVEHTATIDQSTKTITIQLPPHLDLQNIRPEIIVGPKATVVPGNLEFVDFTQDLIEYTVTAESGKVAVYSVVKDMTYKYPGSVIYTVSLPEVIDPETGEAVKAVLKSGAFNCTMEVPQGTDLTRLKLDVDLSPNSFHAVFDTDLSQPLDFTETLTLKVTSETSVTNTYKITVVEKQVGQ